MPRIRETINRTLSNRMHSPLPGLLTRYCPDGLVISSNIDVEALRAPRLGSPRSGCAHLSSRLNCSICREILPSHPSAVQPDCQIDSIDVHVGCVRGLAKQNGKSSRMPPLANSTFSRKIRCTGCGSVRRMSGHRFEEAFFRFFILITILSSYGRAAVEWRIDSGLNFLERLVCRHYWYRSASQG